jgi:hypothetical protein
MVFVPALNTAQANLRFTFDSQQAENTLYFQKAGGPITQPELDTLGSDLATWWDVNLRQALSSTLVMREVYLVDLTSQTSASATYTPGTPLQGGDTTQPLPNNVSFAVSFRTAGRGRSARGRNYIAGLTEQNVTGNELVTTMVTYIVDAYKELLDPATLGSIWTWSVVSRFQNKAARASALVQPITAVSTTDAVVDSQRKRLPGRGR